MLGESDGNDLINNTANKNNDVNGAGFQLTGENNNLTDNFANENEGDGIYLINSSETTVTDNTANENKGYGIQLVLSDQNTVTDNTFKYNEDGCFKEGDFCENNEFNNNICVEPNDSGDSGDGIPGYHIMIIIGITAVIFSFLLVRQKEIAQ